MSKDNSRLVAQDAVWKAEVALAFIRSARTRHKEAIISSIEDLITDLTERYDLDENAQNPYMYDKLRTNRWNAMDMAFSWYRSASDSALKLNTDKENQK